jgi:hypothetical protein
MQLSEKANIAFIYSIVKHQYLGLIIEPFLVEITAAGNFSLSYQRLISSNANLYSKLLVENDYQIIKLLEEVSPERLVKKFYRKGSIRPKEFFEKKCDEALFKNTIRPYIEQRLSDVLELIDGDKLYFAGETKTQLLKNFNFVKTTLVCCFILTEMKLKPAIMPLSNAITNGLNCLAMALYLPTIRHI